MEKACDFPYRSVAVLIRMACSVAMLAGPGCTEAPVAHERPMLDDGLRLELLAMAEADQAARQVLVHPGAPDPSDLHRIRETDGRNLARLREIVNVHGWPGRALAGDDGAHAAWLLV